MVECCTDTASRFCSTWTNDACWNAALGRSSTGAPPELRIQVLGVFRVQVGSWLIPDGAWRVKTARLVKLLALAPRHRLHREEVVDRLWPEFASDSATNNLHRTLHAARHVLEPHLAPGCPSAYLHLRDGWLALTADDGALRVDAEAFEVAGAIARDARDPAAYQAAVELYTGDLLPESRFEDWVSRRREELRGLYLALLLELAQLHETRGEDGSASRALERLVATEPTHEEAHLRLMRLHAVAGRRQQALRQYQQLRRTLRRELGTEPDAAIRRLHQDILDERFPAERSAIPRAVRPGSGPPDGFPIATPSSAPGARTDSLGRAAWWVPELVLADKASPEGSAGPLTSRQYEIAALLAHGLTNRQIANMLVIAGRTADTHLSHILRKLGLRSRAQVAAWAVEHGLLAPRTPGATWPARAGQEDTHTYTAPDLSA